MLLFETFVQLPDDLLQCPLWIFSAKCPDLCHKFIDSTKYYKLSIHRLLHIERVPAQNHSTMQPIPPISNLGSGRLLYSTEEAAQILSLSIHTVTRDVRLGRIQAKKYGRRILIHRSELERIASEGWRPDAA
jgi:excisionase family DNA binding protein